MGENIRKIEVYENGVKRTYDVLFTVEDDDSNREMVFYTDLDSDMDIFVGEYDEKNKTLKYIVDPTEREKLSNIFDTVTGSIVESN
jgi:uncharacterized protein YrzB (UPF0473 family)